MIRVELVKLVRRPRSWMSILLLCGLPVLVAVFVAVTHLAPPPGQGPALLSAVLSSGQLYPAAALAIDRLASAMPFIVGKKAGAPDGSLVRFELTGDAPRRLDVVVRGGRAAIGDGSGSEPTTELRMDLEVFWRLGCGRVTGEAARGAGLVELRGDTDLAERVIDTMAFMI